ncbi:MAG: HD domain-containing protein [Bacilli bacterium]|nr:HD domain-containing protein [Bacilli bacterium]
MNNRDLKKYIENEIFPLYSANDEAHNLSHIMDVINRSFKLINENNLEVKPDMVYTVASYHDIGHHIDAKNHENISAKIMYEDERLKQFFSDEELLIIKEAIEDHRASANTSPRSIYGKIVSSADRNNTVNQCLVRSYFYGRKLDPNASDQELYERAHGVLTKKFGIDGYAKHYFKDSEYELFLKELRTLLADKDKFCQQQDTVIKELLQKKK